MSKKNGKGKINQQKNSWFNFLDTVTSIIIVPILVLSVVCSVIMINAKRNNNVPNIFGYSLVTILSESMVSSGFEIDDGVMVKRVDTAELGIGDIIAYYKYIEDVDTDLSKLAQTGLSASAAGTTEVKYPTESKISSWKLNMNKLFSNATYTATEASEKAIKARSSIIFHQIVDIVDYDGYLWFRTWGTSNVNSKGNPIYDTYWIREDYVIGKYTHTSSAVRGFLSFASTNSGILWMVEVPSGVHLILSTLELVEILDMMTRERHERIKNGTYIDRKEYKKMLRAKRKLLASGNIDVETFRKMYPTYENYDLFLTLDDNKQNVNINGPPDTLDGAKTNASSYGKGVAPPGRDGPPAGEDPTSKGESPPRGAPPGKGRAPDGRDGPPPDVGDSPPRGDPPPGRAPNGRDGPPEDDGPPKGSPPGKGRAPNGRDGPPAKARGDTNALNGSPPGSSYADTSTNLARGKPNALKQINKSLYTSSAVGIYDHEDKLLEHDEIVALTKDTSSHNAKLPKKEEKRGKHEVIISDDELKSMTDIYHWTDVDFIASTDISNKGIIKKPSKNNKVYLVDKKTKKQYSLDGLGTIYSVNTGLITTETGLYRYILNADGITYEPIEVDPNLTIISAKEDVFGNIFIGVVGGSTAEIVKTTSDGKRISIWNRNALLTLGDNKRLYYMSMDGSYDLKKGKITDVKVMNKDAKLVSVEIGKISNPIIFVDGYDKYGFMYLDNNYLCLDKGKLFFNLTTKEVTPLTDKNIWQISNSEIALITKEGNLVSLPLKEYLKAVNDKTLDNALTSAKILANNVISASYEEDNLVATTKDGKKIATKVDKLILACHLNE